MQPIHALRIRVSRRDKSSKVDIAYRWIAVALRILLDDTKAWIEYDVPQCGYCQSGMIMAVVALLKNKPAPTDAEIDSEITNICRCGTFQQVRAAIPAAAKA